MCLRISFVFIILILPFVLFPTKFRLGSISKKRNSKGNKITLLSRGNAFSILYLRDIYAYHFFSLEYSNLSRKNIVLISRLHSTSLRSSYSFTLSLVSPLQHAPQWPWHKHDYGSWHYSPNIQIAPVVPTWPPIIFFLKCPFCTKNIHSNPQKKSHTLNILTSSFIIIRAF